MIPKVPAVLEDSIICRISLIGAGGSSGGGSVGGGSAGGDSSWCGFADLKVFSSYESSSQFDTSRF